MDSSELRHMYEYFKMLDENNAAILEAMSTLGPRNVSAIARATKLPIETVRFRINEMRLKGLLGVRATIDFSKLGLVQVVVFMEGFPAKLRMLESFCEINPYWTYLVRCYGPRVGYYCMYMMPAGQELKFLSLLEKAKKIGFLREFKFLCTTTTFFARPSFKWFNFINRTWDFKWEEWVMEVKDASNQLLPALKEPPSYNILADHNDLLILEHLQEDALRPFTQISRATKIPKLSVRYHYLQHILGKGFITGYRPIISPFPLPLLAYLVFFFTFDNEGALSKFANSIADKPFVHSFAKVLGKNELRVDVHIPFTEFNAFMHALLTLAEAQLISDFQYLTIDLSTYRHWTIRPELFVDGNWEYDHDAQMRKLTQK